MAHFHETAASPVLPLNTRAVLDCIEADLDDWLPNGVVTCCTSAALGFPIPKAEKAIVVNAVQRRQAEFIAARWCAHQALEKIGKPADLVPVGQLGAPQWPEGIIGSITHESGICLAAVAHATTINGIGVDLFDTRRKTGMAEIADLVLNKEEVSFCGSAADGASYIKLAFSAKEAVIKAISAKVGRYLDMREILLSIETDSFQASLVDFPSRIKGRWGNVGSFILTLAILEH
ncbi:MAG: 4'-phosphopantetheinyl transferase family protein [Burkholderiaceae bacterium]